MSLSNLYHIIVKKQVSGYSDEALLALPVDQSVIFACLNQKFIAWKFFIPLRDDQIVLVFDTLLGLESISIAPHVKKVIIVCQNSQIAQTIQSRFNKQLSSSNIEIVVSSISTLSFKEKSIDLVIVNDYSPAFSELVTNNQFYNMVASIAVVTKTTGALFFGFSTGPPIWDLIPYIRSKIALKRSINYTDIIKEYFPSISNTIHCLPTHLRFDEIIVHAWRNERRPLGISLSLYIKHLIITFLFPFGSPNIKMLVYKEANFPPSLLELFFQKFCSVTRNARDSLKIRHIFSGNPSTLICIVTAKFGDLVFRIPITRIALHRNQTQFKTLSFLRSTLPPSLSATVPKVWQPIKISKQYCFVENKIEGIIIDTPKALNIAAEENAVRWLTDFHVATQKCDPHINSLVVGLLRDLLPLLRSHDERDHLFVLNGKIRKHLSFINVNSVCMHGDFKIENIAFSTKNYSVSGVFDWDLSMIAGLPLIDLLYFIIYNEQLKYPELPFAYIIVDKLFKNNLHKREKKWIDHYFEKLSIKELNVPVFAVITWLYHVLFRVHRWHYARDQFYFENIEYFLLNASKEIL